MCLGPGVEERVGAHTGAASDGQRIQSLFETAGSQRIIC